MRSKLGFTLVEMLAVTATTGVLIGLSLPALSKARNASKNTKCLSNLRQMSTGYSTGVSYEEKTEVVRCPSDPNFRSLSYEDVPLPREFYQRPMRRSAYEDAHSWSLIPIYRDTLPYHGWRNAAYMDGHSERFK